MQVRAPGLPGPLGGSRETLVAPQAQALWGRLPRLRTQQLISRPAAW